MTYHEGRKQAHVETEGFLQLILTHEAMTAKERAAYNRVIKYIRNQAGIPHEDINGPERRAHERQTIS